MSQRQAVLTARFVSDLDTYLDGEYEINCAGCQAHNGLIVAHMSRGELIGVTIHLARGLEKRPLDHGGYARFGRPERVLRGKQTRRSNVLAALAGPTLRGWQPFWLNCVSCDLGQLVDPSLARGQE